MDWRLGAEEIEVKINRFSVLEEKMKNQFYTFPLVWRTKLVSDVHESKSV